MTNLGDLRRVARGGLTFLFGNVGSMLLQLVIGVIVVRALKPAEYGLITLGYLVTNILVMLATLGLRNGLPRFLATAPGDRQKAHVGRVSGTALVMAGASSVVLAILAYVGANVVAHGFGKTGVAPVLRAFALMIPPLTLITILSDLFRGAESAKQKMLFQDFGMGIARLTFLVPVVLAGGQIKGVVLAYVASVWTAAFIYAVYATFRLPGRGAFRFDLLMARQLLAFSVPLLGVTFLMNFIGWVGPLSLGYLSTSEQLAHFNAPMRLVGIVSMGITAVSYLYLPIASRMIKTGERAQIGNLYQTVTKWAVLLTLPIALYLLIGARFVVTALFGQAYLGSALVLQVLVLGAIVNTGAGPNGMTLIAWGERGAVLKATALAAVSASGLIAFLVPPYGALGAALATAAANLVANLYMGTYLYRRYRMQPFVPSYLKPVGFVCAIGLALAFIDLAAAASMQLWFAVGALVALVVAAIAAPLVTASTGIEEVALINAIECRLFGRARLALWLEQRGGVN